MRQLLSIRSNLCLLIEENNAANGKATAHCEIVLTTLEPKTEMIDRNVIKASEVLDFRMVTDAKGLDLLIRSLNELLEQVQELDGRFVDIQPSLPLKA